jgi:hypothetical protein
VQTNTDQNTTTSQIHLVIHVIQSAVHLFLDCPIYQAAQINLLRSVARIIVDMLPLCEQKIKVKLHTNSVKWGPETRSRKKWFYFSMFTHICNSYRKNDEALVTTGGDREHPGKCCLASINK